MLRSHLKTDASDMTVGQIGMTETRLSSSRVLPLLCCFFGRNVSNFCLLQLDISKEASPFRPGSAIKERWPNI